jgi:SAM-dependent methyltransferase
MMPITAAEAYIRYLSSKKSVDDRALNRQVWDAMASRLAAEPLERPLRIVEIAAGIGTMVQRMGDWGLVRRADITLVEPNRAFLAESRRRIGLWAAESGYGVAWNANQSPEPQHTDCQLKLTQIPADLSAFLAQPASARTWDLVMAHAFLDLADLSTALPGLCRLARPGGLLYLSINYDGETLFWPELDPAFERRLLRRYNQSMDRRRSDGRSTGGSHTGRRLFGALKAAGTELLSAGSSDWEVFALGQAYPEDEAFFLEFILATLWAELKDHPDLDDTRLQRWYEQRWTQIAAGDLIYAAKNLDFLAQRPEG